MFVALIEAGGMTLGNVTSNTAVFCAPVVLHVGAQGVVEVVAIAECRESIDLRRLL